MLMVTNHKIATPKATPARLDLQVTKDTSLPRQKGEISVVLPKPPVNKADYIVAEEPTFTSIQSTPSKATARVVLPPPPVDKSQYEAFPAEEKEQRKSLPTIILPRAGDIINKEDYIVCPDSPDSPGLSGRRYNTYVDNEDGASDQQQKAQLAFSNLQTFMQDIFEAEDQLNPDTPASGELFMDHDGTPILSGIAHTKVEGLLHKIVSDGRFSQVPADDLIRLQKLCEPGMRYGCLNDIKVEAEEDWESSRVDEWIDHLLLAEVGLKAARTSLRIMTGGREERQLYSEETIQLGLECLRTVVESAIIPIVEMRSTGSTSSFFRSISPHKKSIGGVMNQCRRLLALLNELAGKIELSENVVTTMEYMVSRLVFVENAYSEKDSLLGTQKFDALRVVAMDSLAQIFSSHPEQRSGIFNDILTSLEKLPATKQSARQFKLVEGGSIQLVSALIMRLVQTSACDAPERRHGMSRAAIGDMDDFTTAESKTASEIARSSNGLGDLDPNDIERRAAQDSLSAVQKLQPKCEALMDKAKHDAQYVINFIVNRAMTSTKSGDSPYRTLLDLFVQDFITCLDSPDWPAAELLLRCLLYKMVSLAETDKTAAPAKNMALDLMGEMGAAISQLNSHVRSTVSNLNSADGDIELIKHLTSIAEACLDGKIGEYSTEMISWTGPYRMSLEFLDKRSSGDGALQSAIGYRVAEWACELCQSYDSLNEEQDPEGQLEREHGRLAYRLRMMIKDPSWLAREFTFKSVASTHARLAYTLTVLSSDFCKSFERILMNLLNSMSSDQATVRSKSLKSVNQVLETDPTILDRVGMVMKLILRCASDTSVQVRDSALGLIGKCISLRPAIELMTIPDILQRVSDTGVSVRKRAIRLLKDIYLRNDKEDIRAAIAEVLLHRVSDLDDGVQELARTTIEEVWLAPFYVQRDADENRSPQYMLKVIDHVSLMAKTVNRASGASSVLDRVLSKILSPDSKLATANRRVCKMFVSTMFDAIVDNSTQFEGSKLDYQNSLQLLMIFAKAEPQLFTADQVQLLEPYSSNIKTQDDLIVFRAVVVIWRHVFPQLSSAHAKFLEKVRDQMLPFLGKLSKSLTDDVMACLWIISGALNNKQKLATVTRSALLKISKFKTVNFADPEDKNKKLFVPLSVIVGVVGKHCDLDSEEALIKQALPAWPGGSVAKLIVDTVIPYVSPAQPPEIRYAALESVGMVCQSWPRNFSSVRVYTAFQQIFQDKDSALETLILRSFNDFLRLEEKRAEPATDIPVGSSVEIKATLGIMGGTAHDGVSLEIAQKFLNEITRIALATQDEHAVLATEILCSINRQGLHHPKECGPALVALETSQNKIIADMAFREHKALHEKHETIMEKEYMRAVQAAFDYQRDTVKDVHGALRDTSTAKLAPLLDVLKISKPKSRKRFYESLCARIDFEPAKLDASEGIPEHVVFSQFLVENLAFFDYATIDDLLIALSAMEKVVTGTGSTIAHAIDTEVFKVALEESSQVMPDGDNIMPSVESSTIDDKRLRQLTAGSMVLTTLWEARTFLRRSYGLLNSAKKDSKSKTKDKDTNKAPVKVQGITSDKLWAEFARVSEALSSTDTMKEQCKAFVELLSIDKDFKLAAEGDEEAAARARFSTPSDDEDDAMAPPSGSGRGRKRKGSSTPGGRKKRARSASVSRGPGRPRKQRESTDEDEEQYHME